MYDFIKLIESVILVNAAVIVAVLPLMGVVLFWEKLDAFPRIKTAIFWLILLLFLRWFFFLL